MLLGCQAATHTHAATGQVSCHWSTTHTTPRALTAIHSAQDNARCARPAVPPEMKIRQTSTADSVTEIPGMPSAPQHYVDNHHDSARHKARTAAAAFTHNTCKPPVCAACDCTFTRSAPYHACPLSHKVYMCAMQNGYGMAGKLVRCATQKQLHQLSDMHLCSDVPGRGCNKNLTRCNSLHATESGAAPRENAMRSLITQAPR